ncbi:general secretion pathway protein GspK [bacterium CPR1]|nr:general secretion pathway protein GspK [bacterium CPR1]
MVIVMVLIILMVAITLSTILGDAWISTSALYRHAELRERNYLAARSVVEMAMELLRSDDNDYDGFGDFWALGKQTLPFDGRELTLEITDEDRRFPLNGLASASEEDNRKLRSALVRFLERAGTPPQLALDSLQDWMDPDTLRRPQGAEQGDYGQALVKNAPLDSLEELHYLRGWDNPPNLPPPRGYEKDPLASLGGGGQMEIEEFRRKLGVPATSPSVSPSLAPQANTSKWSDWMSVWSGGRINANTAPGEVLLALDEGMNEAIVQEILSQREQSPLKSEQDLRNIAGMNADLAFRLGSLVGFKSSFFRIRVAVDQMPGRMQLDVVVQREGGSLKVVEWTRL